jgi:hypothetical protein
LRAPFKHIFSIPAEEIEVCLASGAGIHDGREIVGKVVGISAIQLAAKKG